jgi:hypothetical protein
MVALISLLVIVTISLIMVRIGADALTMTGLSRDLAFFQAQSAFSGVGFTTTESESVVSHPARRRIIRLLMLFGNAGITSSIATLILTFYRGTSRELALRLVIVAISLALLCLASTSKLVDRILTKLIKKALSRWTKLSVRDYARLLKIATGFAVSEIEIKSGEWLCDRTLSEVALTSEGVLVLGIRRTDGTYLGIPLGTTTIKCGDVLTCYGRENILRQLSERVSGTEGDAEHSAAVVEQQRIRQEEKELNTVS